ncbi:MULTISPECIES: hypothetical protein [unclassified Anabaena]|nr:hypothetical protein [Anabaena sp. UHCC 0399]MEA5567930.1 hypothetical protein [Anabaena sp. UHCC 0399]
MNTTKKVWTAPAVTVYGNVEAITEQVKPKKLGASDDFGVAGVSDA